MVEYAFRARLRYCERMQRRAGATPSGSPRDYKLFNLLYANTDNIIISVGAGATPSGSAARAPVLSCCHRHEHDHDRISGIFSPDYADWTGSSVQARPSC